MDLFTTMANITNASTTPTGSEGSEGSPTTAAAAAAPAAAPKPRAVRAMLARGAACDLCRSRKVKCDGVRPVCSQCLKSAKGKVENCSCVYEGAGTVAKGAPPAPKRVKSAGDGAQSTEKRAREEEGNEEEAARKKAPGGGARVETLVDRITELERRLRLQAHLPPLDPPFAPSSYPPATSTAAPPISAPSYTPRVSAAASQYSGPNELWSPIVPAYLATSQSTAGGPPPAAPSSTAPFADSSYPPLKYPSPGATNGISDYLRRTSNGYQSASPVDLARTSFASSSSGTNSARLDPSTDYYTSPSLGGSHSVGASPVDSLGLDAQFLQILYPGWAESLPSPSIVNHLVRTFFSRATIASSIFNKPRFLTSLDLSPISANFPATALLHAICAYTVDFVSQDELNVRDERGRTYWEGEKGPKEYHFKEAKKGVDKGVLSKGNTFQILQATIICCYVAYQAADFTDLWLLSGQATRLCTPLGLNHLPAFDYDLQSASARCDWGTRVRMIPAAVTNSLLPPCTTQEEHHERTCTFWAAFAIDRYASAATDWSTSIDEQDISTHLPCYSTTSMPILAFNDQLGRIDALSLKNPDILKRTSAPIGSMGLYIKATILLGRVVNYIQRLPRYVRLPDGKSCAVIKQEMMQNPVFLELDYALSIFRTTVSTNFIDAGNHIDGYLAAAFALPHVANILLHEIFVDKIDRGPSSSLEKVLTSAKVVVNSTYVLANTNNDLLGTDPFLAFTWSVVGRTLVRDLAVRRFWGDMQGAEAARRQAEDCLNFSRQCTRASEGIAAAHAKTLRAFLNNPDLLLPADNIEDPLMQFDPREQLFRDEMMQAAELEGRF